MILLVFRDCKWLGPNLITPSHFQDAIIEQLKAESLESLSVSRVNNTWGITVPNDSNHTIYVWIDALFSYISAIQLSGHNSEAIASAVHVLGKDILKFQACETPKTCKSRRSLQKTRRPGLEQTRK